MAELETVTLDGLPKLASLSSAGMLVAQEPNGPLGTVTQDKLASAHSGGGSGAGQILFTALAAVTIGAFAFTSAGYATPGAGLGNYVSDAKATSALAAEFPQFCNADASGTYFRLARDQTSFIKLSSGGGVIASGLGNSQPAVQALIKYGKAVGISHFKNDYDAIDLYSPPRTTPVPANFDSDPNYWALDGQQLVIEDSFFMEGLPSTSVMNFKGPNGGPWATDFQTVGGVLWRGSMINIMGGTQSAIDSNHIDFFGMKKLKLDGGTDWDGTGPNQTNSSVTHPSGRDLSNRGIRCQNTALKRVWMEDVEVCRTQGENYYMAGGPFNTSPGAPAYQTPTLPQRFIRVKLHGSNQSAFNPSVGGFDCTDCEFGNAFGAYEILGGTGGKLENCKFYNFYQASSQGGPADGVMYNYSWPTRDNTITPPWLDFINCEWNGAVSSDGLSAGEILPGNYVRMTGRTTDCFLTLSALGNGSLIDTHIDLAMTYDRYLHPSYACHITGPSFSATIASATIPPPNSGTFLGSEMAVPIPVADIAKFVYGTQVFITDGTNTVYGVVVTDYGTVPNPTTMPVEVTAVSGTTMGAGATVKVSVPGSNGSVIVQDPTNVHVRLKIRRTALAIATGILIPDAFNASGSFNQDTCTLILDEGDGVPTVGGGNPASPLLSMPLMQVNCPTNSNTLGAIGNYGAAAVGNSSASPAFTGSSIVLAPQQPVLALLNTTTAQTVTVTMSNPFTAPHGYANGQKLRIGYFPQTIAGTIFQMDHNTPGVKLKADRKWWGRDDWLFLEWQSDFVDPVSGQVGAWVEEDYTSPTYFLGGKGSITPSLASGAWGALGTITVPGASVGDVVERVTANPPTGGVFLSGEYTAANTATIYGRNDTGSAFATATTILVEGHRA